MSTDTLQVARQRTGLITWVIIAAGLLMSLWVQFNVSGTAFTIPPESWHGTLQVHLHERPFSARPLQSNATVVLHRLTGLSEKVSFFSIEYLLAGVTAYLFFRLLLQLGFRRAWGNVGIVFFLLSLPVLGAHFAPVNTWDDFWMYASLVGVCLAVLRRRWPLVAILFAVACLARETTILFFPILALMAWRDRRQVKPVILLICLLAPVAAYGAYSAMFDSRYAAGTWRMIEHNFVKPGNIVDSVVSLVNGFGWLLPAAVLGGYLLWTRKRTPAEDFLLYGALLYWPLNTVVSSTFAMVRETRLLFPPFVVVIPLAVYAVNDIWQSGLNRIGWRRWMWYLLTGVALCAIGLWLASVWWPEFGYRTSSDFRRTYAGLSIGLTLAFLLLWLHRRILDRGLRRNPV